MYPTTVPQQMHAQAQAQPYQQQALQPYASRQVSAQATQHQHHPGQPLNPAMHHQPQSSGYRFGDLTRGVIAKGKQARGGDSQKSEYKFGDFTRGLFGK